MGVLIIGMLLIKILDVDAALTYSLGTILYIGINFIGIYS